MSPNHSRDKQHVLLVKKTEVFCKCQDSVTCHYISSPFSLEKVTPAVLGSSSDHPRLHSSVFMHSWGFFFHFFYAILPVKPTLPPAPRKSLYSLLNPLKTFPKKFPVHGTPGAPVPWFHNFYLNLAVTSPANTSKDCLLTMAFENVKHLRLCSLNTDIHLRHAIWKIIAWFSRSN